MPPPDPDIRPPAGMLWRRIAEGIAAEIASGSLAPGVRLPTEAELAARHGVNRHTVRRAMADLADRGLVSIQQGRGSFVPDRMIDYTLARRTRISEILTRQNREKVGRLLETAEIPASGTVAADLDIAAGAPVIRLTTLTDADGRPLSVSDHHFPAVRVPGIAAAFAETGSVTRALALCGVADYTRKVTRLTARPADPRDASLLGQPRNRPVLVSEAVNVDAAGVPVEAGITRFASDRVQMVVMPE